MPELPDIVIYIESLSRRIKGEALESIQLASPFVLRSVTPHPNAYIGKKITGIERIGKRIVLVAEQELFIVFHLMIAGRLKWGVTGARVPARIGLAVFRFTNGNLLLTEAGTKRRASISLISGRQRLEAINPGGCEPLEVDLAAFKERLLYGNHTLKRALTDPHIISGIGNAYSDEILHRAHLSPFLLTNQLNSEEMEELYSAVQSVLREWIDRLRKETGDRWPTKVTAFRDSMAVHGRYGFPCPHCQSPIQRIVYAQNETNYCARCQTGGRILKDRALSRLLRDAWPNTLDELPNTDTPSTPSS